MFTSRLILIVCIIFSIDVELGRALSPGKSRRTTSLCSSQGRRSSTRSALFGAARRTRKQYDSYNDEHGSDRQQQQQRAPPPTQTITEIMGSSVTFPEKPKIVVLGASGKIGRLVVKQLLEEQQLGEATIIAFVRDYDKACRVLYDDLVLVANKKKGPRLQIVHGDLVPPQELPGHVDDNDSHRQWLARATSAAKFFGNSVKDYDDGKDDDNEIEDANGPLQEAIKGCTAIISCVGSVRPTNIWTDLLARPVYRLLKKDVSNWCKDASHPFYVHYASTRKVVRFAEREQMKREAVAAVKEEIDSKTHSSLSKRKDKNGESIPRIRFVRISDLCVAEKPWSFIPVLTNAMQSMVFRYQDMAEKVIEASPLLDTIILRPGDLIDEERNPETTSLQVDPSGKVPLPSVVGREDVAALAVSAALFDSKMVKSEQSASTGETEQPLHCTLAVRWAGELPPYPNQGKFKDGLPSANIALRAAMKNLVKNEKKTRRLRRKQANVYPATVLRIAEGFQKSRKRIKPYGIYVAIPVYVVLTMMLRSLLVALAPHVPGKSVWGPAMSQAWKILTMAFTFLLGNLATIPARLPNLLSSLPRRASTKYISF